MTQPTDRKLHAKRQAAVLSILLLCALPSPAERTVTLPFHLDFDDASWMADLALTECGGTSTHLAGGGYAGGCVRITPPTYPGTGGGINGGATGLGWFTYPLTPVIHIRFLIKFGSAFPSGMLDGGGGLGVKFILLDSPSRIGLLGLCASDTDGRYVAFGCRDHTTAYVYASDGRAWIEDARLKIKDSQRTGEWIALEYWVNTTTDRTGLYVWTLDGAFNGPYIDIPCTNTVASSGFYLSYYNAYGRQDPDNFYLIDNLVVSTSYVGPPDGFGANSRPSVPSSLRVTTRD